MVEGALEQCWLRAAMEVAEMRKDGWDTIAERVRKRRDRLVESII